MGPLLTFAVRDGAAEPHAAVPTLRFTVAIENPSGVPVQAVMLTAQLRVAVRSRAYEAREQARLADMFGPPERWGESARSLYWTHATVVVPPFDERASVALLVPCTYDFDVASAKFFHGVEAGDIPLEFLFSGSVFFTDARGALQTVRIRWDAEAEHRLPVRVWKEMMQHYFPNSAWLRLRRDSFDRLYAYKASRALPTWEEAVDALLDTVEHPSSPG